MAVTMVMEIPGGTREMYDKVLADMGLPPEGQLGAGQLAHVASPMEGGWRVVDVWESEEAFGRFFQERLGKAIAASGMPEMPPPQFFPVHVYRAKPA